VISLWMGSKAKKVLALPAPERLRASSFERRGEKYLVLSYPLPSLHAPATLTSAERVVAVAFGGGASMLRIAAARATSVRTVANQIRSIYAKLHISSRLELRARLVGD
jgi:DNA-binding NarL/FixJ family response regulator